ncbi:MAG: TFIIB-type zinc ribbon-containing protein [Peptococcaceae bacterium]|nr:TFIIB-type zinc ribbon-containing protein [Peptococcaceae bacterium]
MGSSVTEFKCPNCGAPLNFSPEDGEVKCEFCGSTFAVDVLEKLYADAQAEAGNGSDIDWGQETPGSQWAEGEEAALQVFLCPSCGAEIIADDNTIATTCVYCGNPMVLNGRLSGTLKPDFIIPFRKTKDDAVTALKKFYKGKRLLPKVFADANHIDEVKGIYVPFWLFDTDVEGRFVYDATNTSMFSVGDKDITKIDHYRASRKGRMRFDKIPVDGSSKLEDRYMDAIEPFNYDELVPFATAYLPGYLADKYDVDADASMDRVNERLTGSLDIAFASTLHYGEYHLKNKHISILEKNACYALLPVWMLTTRWKDEQYLFAMNGQTGRLVGELPISKGRAVGWFLGITAPLSAIFLALGAWLM